MKLKTLEHLEDAISKESGWRRKELTTVRSEVSTAPVHVQPMLIRAGIALLYAHWEGFVKASAECYIRYVGGRGLKYKELSPPFLGAALKGHMEAASSAKAAWVHTSVAKFIQEQLDSEAQLSASVIRTRSNLTSSVLRDITERVGIPYQKFALREKLIDTRLVNARNGIAHGRYLSVDLDAFLDLHTQVTTLLTDFRESVLDAAQSEGFKLQNAT